MPIDPSAIGIKYQIDLARLADSIRNAKKQLEAFHSDLANLAKKASIKITVQEKQAKAKVKSFANAIQAELDKTGTLKLKAVPEAFGKIGGLTPRLMKDYQQLYDLFGKSPEILGKVNTSFKRVNNAIAEQAIRMQNAGRNGIGFYQNANRVRLVQQELNGTLKATSTGFRNVALETERAARKSVEAAAKREHEKNRLKEEAAAARNAAKAKKELAAASVSANRQLTSMGITSTTTASDIKKMNLSTLDMQRALDLTKTRMRELSKETLGSGKASSSAAREFKILQNRMPFLEHEANKGIKAFGDYRRAMDRWGGGFKYMMLSQAAWIASGAVLFGTLATIGQAVKNFVDFHQDLRDAAAIVQATTTGYQKMEEAAVKAFRNSTMSLKDTTNALKILGQTGMEATDSAIALETVYKVTTATGGDMTTVVKFLTTALNVWKLEASDAAKVGNILGAALNYSKLEVEDLGTTFNYVASMAKSVGLEIEDLAAIMAVMSNAGIKASTIGTGLRGVFSKLLAPTPKFANELAKVGLTLDDVSLKANGFFKVISNLEKAGFDIGNIFRGMTRREAAAMNVLLEQGSERLVRMKENLTDTNAVQVLFERSMRGMKNQMILTGHAIQEYLINRLNFLKPIIIEVAKFLKELFVSLDDLNGLILIVGASWAVYRLALSASMIATVGLTTATGFLAAALNFLNAHPIFAAISALIIGYTALKRIIDATTDSLDEQQSQNMTAIDDLRKLRSILNDTNKTEEERKRIFDEYSRDYPQLLEHLQTHRRSLEDLTQAAEKELEVQRKRTKELQQQRLLETQADLARIDAAIKRQEALKKKYGPESGTAAGGFIKFEFDTGIQKLQDQRKKVEDEVERLKIALGIIFVDKVPSSKGKEEPELFKWLPKHEKAYQKLLLKLGDERERAKKELIKGLEDFGMTEDLKTSYTEKQLDARQALYRRYNERIKKIEEQEWRAHNNAIKKVEERIKKQINQVEAANDKERKILSKASKFREQLQDDESDLIKDDYERRGIMLEKDISKRRRKYNELLADTKDYYNELAILAKENPLLAPELRQVELLIKIIEAYKNKLKEVEGQERKNYASESPTNFMGGLKEGLRQARTSLKDEYSLWQNLSREGALGMRDAFSDLFFDAMKGELKSLSDYWNLFADTVKRKMADIAATWITSGIFGTSKTDTGLIGWLGNITGLSSLLHDTGGKVRLFDSGGSPGATHTLGILKKDEYVIRDSSAKSIGTSVLDFINRTGRLPQNGQNVSVNNTYAIYAMDSESIDQALRRGGAKAIQEISLGSVAYARDRRDPILGRR